MRHRPSLIMIVIATVAIAVVSLGAHAGQAQEQQLTVVTVVGWEVQGDSDNPFVSISADVPPDTTRAVFEYGPADTGEPPQTTAGRLDIRPGFSRAYLRVELRYGVRYTARLTAETPAGALTSPQTAFTPETRILRSSPYLRYGQARPPGSSKGTLLQNVQILGARGWHAWDCPSTKRLSVRDCRLARRAIATNRPVVVVGRRDIRKRPLRIVLERDDNKSGRRIKLTVRSSGRGTISDCIQITLRYSNDCPSISFVGNADGTLNTVIVDPAVRFTPTLVGVSCVGPGCPTRYQERHPHSDGKVLRFTGYRGLRRGAEVRVSVRARGYDGASRTARVRRGGLDVSGYECLANGSTTIVVPCR